MECEQIFRLLEKRDISKENKEVIRKFLEFKRASGISPRRLRRIEYTLSTLAKIIDKPIDKVDSEDLIKFIRYIDNKNLSINSILTCKFILKNYLRYVYKGNLPREMSEILKTRQWKTTITSSDLLKEEEIEKMVNTTQSIRRKAILMVCYEGALRPGELLSLKVGDVEFTEWGARIFVRKSKTRLRTLPLLMSAPLLSQYLRIHPSRDNPNSPLWLNDKGKQFAHNGFIKLLKDLSRKAGINKRVYPYLLRHSRITHLIPILQPSEIKKLAGWSNIRRLDTYEHLSSMDIENRLLESYGIKKEQKKPKAPYKICPRCNCKNEPDAKYCASCGLGLEPKEIIKSEKYLEIGKKVLMKEHIRKIIKEELKKMLKEKEIELQESF